jgi:hypothetical protein
MSNSLIYIQRGNYNSSSVRAQNDFKSSYEFIEKTEILNKYFSSISNLNDENKVLPDFDCRCLNVKSY